MAGQKSTGSNGAPSSPRANGARTAGAARGEVVPVTKHSFTEAMLAVAGTLAKDATNTFSDYRYVSVDSVYGHCREELALRDLAVWQTEVHKEWIPINGPNKAMWVDITFALAITPGGRAPEKLEDAERLSAFAPVTGAQTAGAMRSYASKYYLRGKFLLATGEQEDIDATSRQALVAHEAVHAPEPQGAGRGARTQARAQAQAEGEGGGEWLFEGGYFVLSGRFIDDEAANRSLFVTAHRVIKGTAQDHRMGLFEANDDVLSLLPEKGYWKLAELSGVPPRGGAEAESA